MLLVMISIAIYQATTQTFRYRARIINEGDFYGGVRLAMGLMDRDVAALFSPVAMNPNNYKPAEANVPAVDNPGFGQPNAFNNSFRRQSRNTRVPPGKTPEEFAAEQIKLEELKRSDLGQLSDYWMPATDLTAIRPSRFIGTENRIQFVSGSHQRVYRDSMESDFAKIVYETREEKEPITPGTRILVRIEDANVFDDTAKGESVAKTYPLLPGVKSFTFRYFRKDKRAWERTWDSNRDDMKGLYPDLIELTLEVTGLNKLSFKGTYMFKPENFFYGLDSSF